MLRDQAEQRQTSLLGHATRMQGVEADLASVLERSHEALARADAATVSSRKVSVAQLMDYAERVSYSNAAPVGAVAMAAGSKDGFRGGWGTPMPQQHMLAVSRFAAMNRQTAPDSAGAPPAPAPAASVPPVPGALAFTSAPAPRPSTLPAAASLDINSDDDEFE